MEARIMSYIISVYKIDDSSKIECNVIAFFQNAISMNHYVIVEFHDNEGENIILPFIVDNNKAEQELQLLTEDIDKQIVIQYCKENLGNKNINFTYSENVKFLAILDLKSMRLIDTYHRIPIQEMLDQKNALDVDKAIRQIDKKIIELSLDELNEIKPESATEFIKNCIDISRYDLWLNKKIEDAKSKISNFSHPDEFIHILEQLKAFQTLINLLSGPSKEKHMIEDALIDFIGCSGGNELDLKKILDNDVMQSFLSEHERKTMYRTIVLRANNKFTPKTVNAVANYFYKENDFSKAIILFNSLVERYQTNSEGIDLVETYNSIGCCYVGMMMFDDAYKAFEKTIKIDSNYAVAYNNWAYALAVECDVIPKDSSRDEKLNTALRYINRAIQHKNDDVAFYSNKACIEYELNSFQAVIEDYNDASSVSSNYKDLETILTLKLFSKIELYYTKKQTLEFNDLLNDLEIIFKNNTGKNKYLFQALDVYHKIRSDIENADEVCLNLLVFEFIVNKLMASLAIRDLNQEIYFYTSLSSLQKLLADDEFKQPIFCANHMNDPNEGQELYKTFLGQIDKKELIQDVFQKTEASCIQHQRQKLNVEFTFLKAFTENDDSLPMWIHYGDKGAGCCVKVNPRFFSNFKNDSDSEEKNLGKNPFDDEYRLYRVLYLKDGALPDNTDLEIKELYNSFINLFKELCSQYAGYPSHLKNIVSNSVVKIINSVIYLFKNIDYQYEKEMRIVLRRSASDFERDDIDIQVTNSTEKAPVPKVFIYAKKPLEIEEVILGPKTSEIDDIIPYITMRLLRMNNYQEEKVYITKSLIKYR